MKYYPALLLVFAFGIAKAQRADEKAVVGLIVQQNHDTSLCYSNTSSIDVWSVKYCDSVINGGQKVIDLSPKDKKELTAKLMAAKNPSAWPGGYFNKMVPGDTIKEILSDTSLGWRYFKQKYSGCICTISKPVFIHNNTICLIAYSMSANYTDYNNKQEVEWGKRYGESGSFSYEIRIYVKQPSGEWVFKGTLLKEIT